MLLTFSSLRQREEQRDSLLCWKYKLLSSVKHYHIENDILKIVTHQLWTNFYPPPTAHWFVESLGQLLSHHPVIWAAQTSRPLIFPQFLHSFYPLSSVPAPTHNGRATRHRTLTFTEADTDICMWCGVNESESSLQALCHIKENCPGPLHEFRPYLTFRKCHYLTL